MKYARTHADFQRQLPNRRSVFGGCCPAIISTDAFASLEFSDRRADKLPNTSGLSNSVPQGEIGKTQPARFSLPLRLAHVSTLVKTNTPNGIMTSPIAVRANNSCETDKIDAAPWSPPPAAFPKPISLREADKA